VIGRFLEVGFWIGQGRETTRVMKEGGEVREEREGEVKGGR
jgi:hypothetical protein